MRVLVVDDSAVVRQRLSCWLAESTRIELGEAVRPGEALERLRARATDLVVLDLHLSPLVSGALGLDLIGCIKRLLPRVVVVVLSNAASELYRRECLRRGADHVFDKSLEFERAIALISDHAATLD